MGVLPDLGTQLKKVWKSGASSIGAEDLLSGAQYALETINFVCFISEEAEQAATSGCSLGVQSDSLYLAQRLSDECMGEGNAKIWEFTVMYAMGFSPTWPAFYCFMYMTNIYQASIRRQLAAAWVKKGYYTRKDMEGWTGRRTTMGEDLGLSNLSSDGIDQKRKTLESWRGETGDFIKNIAKLLMGEEAYKQYWDQEQAGK